MSGTTWHFIPAAPAGRLGKIAGDGFRQIGHVLAVAARMAATRRQLADLDDRMLQDLGISRAQAAFEASRAPWDTAFRRPGNVRAVMAKSLGH